MRHLSMQRGSFFAIAFLLSTVLLAQRSAAPDDSLEAFIRTPKKIDTLYVRALDKVIYTQIYRKAAYARADSLSRRMEDAATQLTDWRGVVSAYRNLAMSSFMSANYKQAMVYFEKTLAAVEQHDMGPKMVYGALCNVVIGHEKLGHDERVLQTALRAIRYQEKYQLKPRAPIPHRLIGGTLVKMGKARQAIPYYNEAGVIFRENGDKRGIAIFENQLGNFYRDLKQPQQALVHHRQSLALAEELQFELLQFDALDGIATDMARLNRPAEGLAQAQRALAIVQKQKNQLGICTIYTTMGRVYQAQKDYSKAEAMLKQAIDLANTNGYKDELKTASQLLADVFAEQKNFQEAYVYQLQKNKLVDSAALVNTNAEVQRLIAKYEADKKEAQINLLQQQARLREQEADRAAERTQWQQRAMLGGGTLLLLLGVAVSAWLLNRAKVRRLEEAQRLRTQIARDLHDEVGSTLSSISLLSSHTDQLLTQNRPEKAQQMVQKIYTDARQILEGIDEIIWTINPSNDSLQRIILRLREYAQPLMESRNIRLTFEADPALDLEQLTMETRRNLYLVCKEAINNLVKHAEASAATIRFSKQNDQLRVTIADDGQGFEPAQPSTRNGQASMQQRVAAMGGTLAVQSAPGAGTQFELALKL